MFLPAVGCAYAFNEIPLEAPHGRVAPSAGAPLGPAVVKARSLEIRYLGAAHAPANGEDALADGLRRLAFDSGHFTDKPDDAAFVVDGRSTLDVKVRKWPFPNAVEYGGLGVFGIGAVMFMASCSPCRHDPVTAGDQRLGWSGLAIGVTGAVVSLIAPVIWKGRIAATAKVDLRVVAPDGVDPVAPGATWGRGVKLMGGLLTWRAIEGKRGSAVTIDRDERSDDTLHIVASGIYTFDLKKGRCLTSQRDDLVDGDMPPYLSKLHKTNHYTASLVAGR
ncbi:MAG TPA: hypothetical protein VG389_24415 [Myxococcota bacterium]|nr:hypothetical protein [Myxococcota bacterium]